ncbi:hypothetical protein IL306_004964 [Fusarium sp. DS 682]|nr:hypothetical protein IL306_004964 [Fusarium sp. DS 682]
MDNAQSRIDSLEAQVAELRLALACVSSQTSDQNVPSSQTGLQGTAQTGNGGSHMNGNTPNTAGPSKLSLLHKPGDIRAYFPTTDSRFKEDKWLCSEPPEWNWRKDFLLWAKEGWQWDCPRFRLEHLRHDNAGECQAGESCDHWMILDMEEPTPTQGTVQLEVICVEEKYFDKFLQSGSSRYAAQYKTDCKPTFIFNALKPDFKVLREESGLKVLLFRVLDDPNIQNQWMDLYGRPLGLDNE